MIIRERFKAGRMLVIWPLLSIFILFSTWGLSDPKIAISGIVIDSAYDVIFASTAFIIFSATMGAVLISFDGISRDRISGVLEIKLSQPISRTRLGFSMMVGHWAAIAFPVFILNLFSIAIIYYRMDEIPTALEIILYNLSTGLLLWWYTVIQLIASTWARDMGTSISFGLGIWMIFTMLWLILTTLVAGLSGISVEDPNSSEFVKLGAFMDLFSPNGVYNLLTEIPLSNNRGLGSPLIFFSTALWTVIPPLIFIRRMKTLKP
jgi:ABC-type transport system involved in multi-copper enzyme maturation permease subunit